MLTHSQKDAATETLAGLCADISRTSEQSTLTDTQRAILQFRDRLIFDEDVSWDTVKLKISQWREEIENGKS